MSGVNLNRALQNASHRTHRTAGRRKFKRMDDEKKEKNLVKESTGFSPNHFGDEKILNASAKDIFMHACDSLEHALKFLTMEYDKDAREKLLYLQYLIEQKLLIFLDDTSESERSYCSTSVTSSTQNIFSETLLSCADACKNEFEEFLRKVNCPFCFTLQADKINLVKHLDESCIPLKNNEYSEKKNVPFAVFQILPNNSIKCNICEKSVQHDLEHFFRHKQSKSHITAYSQAEKIRKYTEFLFCSCCKVLVPNNYTQLNFHITHEVHKVHSGIAPNLSSRKGYICVYLKNKNKFKCQDCPSQPTYESPMDILKHFRDGIHKKQKKKSRVPKIFCEFCQEEVHIYEVISHFNSGEHRDREEARVSGEWFEMCYYCGFCCKNLMQLSAHMKATCSEIICIREKLQTSENFAESDKKDLGQSNTPTGRKIEDSLGSTIPKSEKNISEDKPTENVEIEEDNNTLGPHILIRGSTELPVLYKYFQKFGEIVSVEISEDGVLIQFREKSAVQEVLMLRNVIKVNGVKLEVRTGEKLIKSDKEMEKPGKEIYDRQKLVRNANVVREVIKFVENDRPTRPDHSLADLFLKVTQQLSNITKKFHSDVKEKVLLDCEKTLNPEKCSFVGFTGFNLSFPVETISLYVDLNAKSLSSAYNVQEMLQILSKKLSNAYEWESGACFAISSVPYFKTVHKATRKTCTFTISRSAKVLTDMLRACTNHDSEYLALLIRFWLSVHDLKIRESEYTIISLFVFFLINKGFARPLSTDLVQPRLMPFYNSIADEIVCVQRQSDNAIYTGSSDLPRFFKEFLKFLHNFDFSKNAIVLPFQYPVPKVCFYTYLRHSLLDSFDEVVNSPICILDPDLHGNLASDIKENDLKSLLETVESTLEKLDDY